MSKFFVLIYNFLEKKHWCRNILLIGTFLLLVFFAVQVKFEEDVTRFFPDTQDAKNSEIVFKNLKVKDKIILMLSPSDRTKHRIDADALIFVENALEGR